MTDLTKGATAGRLHWLDWMKLFSIVAIIWGHFFSAGHVYLYLFSVQAFCIISGFLYKKAPNWKSCLEKNFWQLLVPTLLLSVAMHLEAMMRAWSLGLTYSISWPRFFYYLLKGYHWCMGPCWFFYMLFIIRIIMQLLPQHRLVHGVLFVLLSGGAIGVHLSGIDIANAWVNVLVCMPMFLLGVFLQPLREWLTRLHNYKFEVVLLVLAVAIILFCGEYNGYVWMYRCGYGNSFLLFVVGALGGIMLLYIVSLWVCRLLYSSIVEKLSSGSILIVGVHIIIVRRLMELPNRTWGEDLLFSLMILLAFYPIIILTKRYCPILLGQYRRKGKV